MRARVLAVWFSCCALWGSTWIVVRLGLDDLPPLLFAGARMCLAGALLAPWALRSATRDAPWRWMAGIGLLQIAIPYGLMFAAQQWIASGLAAVLFATFPVWVALLARALLPGERLGPARVASVLLGVAGVAVLQSRALGEGAGGAGPGAALGGALVVLAAIVCAGANVLVKRRGANVSPQVLTCAQTFAAGPALLLASLVLERGREVAWTARALGAVGYLAAFCTVLTYLGLYWLMPRVPLQFIATIPLLDTTTAVALGAALLGEPVGWHLAAGGAMVLAAAALAGRAQQTPATSPRGEGTQQAGAA